MTSSSILIGSIENQDHLVDGLILKTIMCVEQYLSLSITIYNLLCIICFSTFFVFLFVFVYCCSFCRGDHTEAYS